MQSILQNYQIILDSIEEGVFTVNMQWSIMSFNRAAERITGRHRNDVIGRKCKEIFKANLCNDGCVLKRTLEMEIPFSNIPIYIERADGERIPISANTGVLKASDGRIIGGVQTFRDLTAFRKLQIEYRKQHSFQDIVSKNEKMLKYFSILPQIAESGSTVTIEGPTGTGKELFARAIHNHSGRKNGPFIAVNCGAMPDTLIESELFGYKAGAFTDAKKDKPGRFALADKGTIFLDEIGDTSSALQIRLLRVLQEKQYEPLGSTKSEMTNARVIVATHRNLEQLVNENRFRQDLFYRINVIRISIPPLSERKEDIPLLAEHFIERFNYARNKKILGLTQDAITACILYDWPGNVRELENAIEHAFILCDEDLIGIQHLPEQMHPLIHSVSVPSGISLQEIEKQAICQALKRNNWKRMATARDLGIDKNTLRRKINKFAIRTPDGI